MNSTHCGRWVHVTQLGCRAVAVHISKLQQLKSVIPVKQCTDLSPPIYPPPSPRYIISYYAPGGDAWYSVMLNPVVHVVMYTYYLIASFVKEPAARKKYLWWGKYLTQF